MRLSPIPIIFKMTMTPVKSDLQSQLKAIEIIVLRNAALQTILERAPDLSLPNWYLGAGCISQIVWNFFYGRDLLDNINDADLVYFDDTDLSFEAEDRRINLGRELFSDVPIHVDIRQHISADPQGVHEDRNYRHSF